MLPTTMPSSRPPVSAQVSPAPLDPYSLTGKAEVAPAQPYQNMLLGMTGFQSGNPSSKSARDPYAQVQRFLGPSGVGYHLPVAALQGDQIWNDSFRQPYVGPLDFDNWGFGQPIETFEMRRQYRELYRKEPSIRSAVDGMTESVAVLDVSVLPQDPRSDWDCQTAEYLNWTVENTLLGWDGLIQQTAKPAIIDGYAALEKVLNDQLVTEEQSRQWEGKWQLLHCRPLDTFWIKLQVDQFRNVLNVVNTVRGLQYYNIDKVLLFSHASLYGNPFGQSSLRACIRAANIIQDAYQLWYLALKMFGLPYLYGQYKNANQKKMMEDALANMRAGGFAVSGIEDDIKILSLAGAANFSAFEQAINKLREDNYLAIRGAYLPFLEGTGSPDSRGNTMVSKVASDAKSELLANQLGRLYTHQLGPWVVHDNFPRGTGYPIVVIGGTNWEETAKTLDVGLTMAKEFGLPLSKHQLYKRGGWSPPDNEADDTVDYNAIQARAQLMQGQVQLQLQAAGQQQQLAAQAQAAQLQGAAGGQAQAGGGGPPTGGGGAPPGGGGGGGNAGGSDFTVQAEPFSEGAKRESGSKSAIDAVRAAYAKLSEEHRDGLNVWANPDGPKFWINQMDWHEGEGGKAIIAAAEKVLRKKSQDGYKFRNKETGEDDSLPKGKGVYVFNESSPQGDGWLDLCEQKTKNEVTSSQFAALAQSIMAEQGMAFADPQPRRGRVNPTYPDLVTHAAAAMDNPLDNTAGMAFADHLAEAHPDHPAVQEFQNWVQGGDWGSLGRELAMHTGGYEPRGGYPSLDRSLDAPDFELKPRRDDTQEPKLSTYSYGKRLDEPTWHLRVPDYGSEHGISTRRMARRKPLSTAEVANAIYQARGPSELIKAYLGARHFHPDNPKGASAPGDGTLAGRTRPVFSENVSMEAFASDWTKLDRHPGTGRWHRPGTLSPDAASSLSSPSKASSSSLPKDKFADDPASKPKPLDTSHFEQSPPAHTQAEFHHTLVHTPEDKTAAGVYADWLQDQGKDAHAEVVRGHGQQEGMGGGTLRLSYHPQEVANFVPGQFYFSHEAHYPQVPYGSPQTMSHYVALHQLSEAPHQDAPEWRHILQWHSPSLVGGARAALVRRLVAEGAQPLPRIAHGAGLEHLTEGPEETFAAPSTGLVKPTKPSGGTEKSVNKKPAEVEEPTPATPPESTTPTTQSPQVDRTGPAPVKRGVFGRVRDWALSKLGTESEKGEVEERRKRELGAKNVAERDKRVASKLPYEVVEPPPVTAKTPLGVPNVGYDPSYTPTTRADRTVTPGTPKRAYRPLPQATPVVKPGGIVDTTADGRRAAAAVDEVNQPEAPNAPGVPTAGTPVIKPLPNSVTATLPPLKLPGVNPAAPTPTPVTPPTAAAPRLPADDTGLPVGNETPAPTNRVPPPGETAKTPTPTAPTQPKSDEKPGTIWDSDYQWPPSDPAQPKPQTQPQTQPQQGTAATVQAKSAPMPDGPERDELHKQMIAKHDAPAQKKAEELAGQLGLDAKTATPQLHRAIMAGIAQAMKLNKPGVVNVNVGGKNIRIRVSPKQGKYFSADSTSGGTGFSVEYAFAEGGADQYTADNLLHQLQQPEHAEHMAGHDNPLSGLRGIAADALDERGRPEEASLLRTPGQHLVISRGRVLPHHMDRYSGLGGGEHFQKTTYDGPIEGEDDHGFTHWFPIHNPNDNSWYWNPGDGEGLHRSDAEKYLPNFEGNLEHTEDMSQDADIFSKMKPSEVAWMKRNSTTPEFK